MLLPIESTKKVFTFQWNAFKKAWKEKKYRLGNLLDFGQLFKAFGNN